MSLDKIKAMLSTANEQQWLYFAAGFVAGARYRGQILAYLGTLLGQ